MSQPARTGWAISRGRHHHSCCGRAFPGGVTLPGRDPVRRITARDQSARRGVREQFMRPGLRIPAAGSTLDDAGARLGEPALRREDDTLLRYALGLDLCLPTRHLPAGPKHRVPRRRAIGHGPNRSAFTAGHSTPSHSTYHDDHRLVAMSARSMGEPRSSARCRPQQMGPSWRKWPRQVPPARCSGR